MNAEEILNDKAASYWLKTAIEDLEHRDPVDVLNDLEILLAVTKQRLDSVALAGSD